MSYFFRGGRADIETGLPGFIPDRRSVRIHAGSRPVNNNSMAFLVTVLVLFMILNSHQMSPNFLLWLVLGVFLTGTTILRMYATCQQIHAQAQAHAAAASGLLGHTELQLHVPPSIAFATRGRLQSLRLQLALLDREFDDLDYDALSALDSDNVTVAPSMTEEEIGALPVHKYKGQPHQGSSTSCQSGRSSLQQESSSSTSPTEKTQESTKLDGNSNSPDDELICSVCLEQVSPGELIKSLPCLHQFHANCIDPWLRQQSTCPVCKHRVISGWHAGADADQMDVV
ncbi:E3 ubiquitin-protein ligase [Canna indica]|uniref:RING-type E3 ubiquitin transferase n=1 Tax=Canna indica TaxID=4628 RepID=A0AAQ3QMR2_9LILI|nr:E3 ubiquitin-protein ligase [Canna indica]